MTKYIKDLYFFLVVLYSGLSLAFFRSKEGLIVLWAIGFVIFFRTTLNSSKKLWIALGVWMGYFIINTLIIRSLHPFFMGTYIVKIMIAYWLIDYYKEKIYFKYENTIYALAVISLIFYFIQLVVPTTMYNFFKTIDLSQNLFPERRYASIGVYTFHQKYLSEIFPRNAGFCWEPGPFSLYILLAIFFNLVRNKMKIKNKIRIIILLLTFITTQSTTGFVGLFVLLIWYSWIHYNNKIYRYLSLLIAIAIGIFLFFSVPWLQEKISKEYEQKDRLNELLVNSKKYNKSYAPGRFISFKLGVADFKAHPITGYGGNTTLRYGYQFGSAVSTINGLANIMGRYGAIGLLIFFYLLFITGKYLASYYNYPYFLIFPILILIISFGFGIIEEPLLFTIIISGYFLKKT